MVKNKVAPPFRGTDFYILYGEGISKEGDLIDLGVAQNILEKSGSRLSKQPQARCVGQRT